MSAGDIKTVHRGPHGLAVATIESTTQVTPQITFVEGVLGTPDAAEVMARTGDIDNYKRREVRRAARDDRRR